MPQLRNIVMVENNKNQLQKELLEKVKPGTKPSEVKKKKQVEKNLSIPTPPSPPPEKEANNPELQKRIEILEKKLERVLKTSSNSEKMWSETAQNYLASLQREMAANDRLKAVIEELTKNPARLSKETELALQEAQQIIRDLQKGSISVPTTRNIPIFISEQDSKIIEQAKAHLTTLNSERIRNRVEQANEEGTRDAYVQLLREFNTGNSPLYNRLEEYKGTSEAFLFVDKLSRILQGEYLEEN